MLQRIGLIFLHNIVVVSNYFYFQAFLDEFTKWSRINPDKAKIPTAGDTQGLVKSFY